MPYTKSQINNIHQTASGINRKRYISLDGTVYLGLPNGRLRLLDKAALDAENKIKSTENSLNSLEDSVNSIEEQGSYFALNINNNYHPVEDIHDILEENIFELNEDGQITISIGNTRDEFFELNAKGQVTPKDLFNVIP